MEPKTKVINGALHIEKNGLYQYMPRGIDDARLKVDRPKWLDKNGKLYKAFEAEEFVKKAVDDGATMHMADRNDNVIIRLPKIGDMVHGLSVASDEYILTAADADGSVIIDNDGNVKQTVMSEDKLRECYDVPEQISNGTFVRSNQIGQMFIQAKEDIAIRNEHGFVTAEKGSYINTTNIENIEVITPIEFEMYTINGTSTKMPDGSIVVNNNGAEIEQDTAVLEL